MSEWQPIETAPIDEPVLVGGFGTWGLGEMTVAEYRPTLFELDWKVMEPGANPEDRSLSFRPTHWMPLPDPPK